MGGTGGGAGGGGRGIMTANDQQIIAEHISKYGSIAAKKVYLGNFMWQ